MLNKKKGYGTLFFDKSTLLPKSQKDNGDIIDLFNYESMEEEYFLRPIDSISNVLPDIGSVVTGYRVFKEDEYKIYEKIFLSSTNVYSWKMLNIISGSKAQIIEKSQIGSWIVFYGDSYEIANKDLSHVTNYNNPHKVTKVQIDLGNVINLKQAKETDFVLHRNDIHNPHKLTRKQVSLEFVENIDHVTDEEFKAHSTAINPHVVTKEQIGLGNVDNVVQIKEKELFSHIDNKKNPHNISLKTVSLEDVTDDLQITSANLSNHVFNINNPHAVNPESVGLKNVTNDKQLKIEDLKNHLVAINPHKVNSSQIAGLENVINTKGVKKEELESHILNKMSHVTSADSFKEQVRLDKVTNNKQAKRTEFILHRDNTSNPHSVTKEQVGLGNVDNGKHVLKVDFDAHVRDPLAHDITLKQLHLDKVINKRQAKKSEFNDHVSNGSAHGFSKERIGLGNVENVLQATEVEFLGHVSTPLAHKITKAVLQLDKVDNTKDTLKPISTSQQTGFDALQNTLGNDTNKIVLSSTGVNGEYYFINPLYLPNSTPTPGISNLMLAGSYDGNVVIDSVLPKLTLDEIKKEYAQGIYFKIDSKLGYVEMNGNKYANGSHVYFSNNKVLYVSNIFSSSDGILIWDNKVTRPDLINYTTDVLSVIIEKLATKYRTEENQKTNPDYYNISYEDNTNVKNDQVGEFNDIIYQNNSFPEIFKETTLSLEGLHHVLPSSYYSLRNGVVYHNIDGTSLGEYFHFNNITKSGIKEVMSINSSILSYFDYNICLGDDIYFLPSNRLKYLFKINLLDYKKMLTGDTVDIHPFTFLLDNSTSIGAVRCEKFPILDVATHTVKETDVIVSFNTHNAEPTAIFTLYDIKNNSVIQIPTTQSTEEFHVKHFFIDNGFINIIDETNTLYTLTAKYEIDDKDEVYVIAYEFTKSVVSLPQIIGQVILDKDSGKKFIFNRINTDLEILENGVLSKISYKFPMTISSGYKSCNGIVYRGKEIFKIDGTTVIKLSCAENIKAMRFVNQKYIFVTESCSIYSIVGEIITKVHTLTTPTLEVFINLNTNGDIEIFNNVVEQKIVIKGENFETITAINYPCVLDIYNLDSNVPFAKYKYYSDKYSHEDFTILKSDNILNPKDLLSIFCNSNFSYFVIKKQKTVTQRRKDVMTDEYLNIGIDDMFDITGIVYSNKGKVNVKKMLVSEFGSKKTLFIDQENGNFLYGFSQSYAEGDTLTNAVKIPISYSVEGTEGTLEDTVLEIFQHRNGNIIVIGANNTYIYDYNMDYIISTTPKQWGTLSPIYCFNSGIEKDEFFMLSENETNYFVSRFNISTSSYSTLPLDILKTKYNLAQYHSAKDRHLLFRYKNTMDVVFFAELAKALISHPYTETIYCHDKILSMGVTNKVLESTEKITDIRITSSNITQNSSI